MRFARKTFALLRCFGTKSPGEIVSLGTTQNALDSRAEARRSLLQTLLVGIECGEPVGLLPGVGAVTQGGAR